MIRRVPNDPLPIDSPRSDDDPFDAHHQLQSAMIDAYEAALLNGSGSRLAADTLGHLVDFTAVHFQEEEQFMAQRSYPWIEIHRGAHAQLMSQLRELEAGARQAGPAEALAAVPSLRAWLADHVGGMDRDLFEWAAQGDQERRPSPSR